MQSDKRLERFADYVEKNKTCNVKALLTQFMSTTTHTHEPLQVSIDIEGLSTSLTCKCKNGCDVNVPHELINNRDKRKGRHGSEEYAINTRFVIALQQVGGCGSEAEAIMASLNLPGSSNMKTHTFHRVENEIGKLIRNVAYQQCDSALEEEVFLTLEKEGRSEYFEKWKQGEAKNCVSITACYDMGWNKRSSGHRYDSNSGHAFLIGALTKK